MALAIAALLLGGCATTGMEQWQSRVGLYSLDDAIAELGPPDKRAELSDGTVVAEWLRVRGGTQIISSHLSRPYPSRFGYMFHHPMDYQTIRWPDNFLRLTFGPDKRLREAKRVPR